MERGDRSEAPQRPGDAVEPQRAEAARRRSFRTALRRGALGDRRRSHILLAEDDAEFRTLLGEAFRSAGFEVTECVDGRDLVSKLGTFVLFGPPAGFDLVVSDIRMPGATALEIVDAMRGCDCLPPVILMTAFASQYTPASLGPLGVAAVFDKPFEIEKLVATVEDLLAKRVGDGA